LTRDKDELVRVAKMTWTPGDTGLLYVAFYDENGDLVAFKDWSNGTVVVPQHEDVVEHASVEGGDHTGDGNYGFHAPVALSREMIGDAATARAPGAAETGQAERGMVAVRRSPHNLMERISAQQCRMLLINGVVFAVGGLVLSVLVYRLIRPVSTLVRGTERVAAGDLETPVEVGRRRDEMRTLADSFNRMTGQLREQRSEILAHSRDLEQKVLERTAELARANEDLQSELAERRRAEQALQKRTDEMTRSNAELERFVFIASHDLQEPLRTVTGYVQLLARRYRGQLDADADEFIDFAVGGATRMSTLIDDLLAYSRVIRRDKPLEPTDCEAVLAEVLADLRAAIDETGAEVTHDPLPTVVADRVQLASVFLNLISNGIKYRSDEPTRIHISAEREDDVWTFAVSDNGVGIDPKYHERVFDVFKRLHTREQYEGTGIGLAISKRVVQRHGGRIWVESEPGKGSTFLFTIPAMEETDRDHTREREACGSASG